jgi:hypothetical protein
VVALVFGYLLFGVERAHASQGLNLEAYDCGWQYNQSPPEGCNTTGQSLGVVPYIDFNDGSSGPLGVSEDYQYHWSGYLQQTSGLTVQFRACSDDGMRLYINGQLIVNNWFDRGGQCGLPVSYAMTNNDWVPIDVWFYENGGGSNGSLQWNIGDGWVVVPSSVFSTTQVAPVVKTIGAPRNLTISSGETSTVLSWEPPNTGNTQPERYAISFNCTGCNGWGIATGNVGGPNSLNTTITIDNSLLNGLMPAGTIWSFHIRSDNDTFSLYSENSNVVTGSTYVAPAPEPYVAAPLPFNYTYRVDENGSFSINAPSGKMIETITAWYGDPNDGNYGALVTDTLTASHSGETTTVIYANNDVFGDPVPGVGKILIANVTFIDLPGPTPEEIAAQQEAESETVRQNQASAAVLIYETATMTTLSDYNPITALKDVAQSLVDLVRNLAAKVGLQSRIDYKSASINNTKSSLEAQQAAAEAEIAAVTAAQALAQQAEAARIQAETAAIIAAQAAAAQAEANRIAAEEAAREAARIQAEAEAKAEADRIEAEIEAARIQAEIEAQEEADRIAAEVKAAEEKAEAEAKAEAERIAAEEEAERIAAEEAAAEAEAKAKAEEEAIAEEIRQAEEDAKAEADAIEAEEKAKELEEEKAAEEEEKAKEEELKKAEEDAKDGKELTEEQKEVVVEALLEDLKPGEAVTAAAVAASGVSYADLPPETPVEVRTDENGNALVITAEVAANVELVQDPGALLEAAFTDPGAALAALGSIGADMTEEEREEATDMVVATVVAAGAAINAAAVATGGATGGGTGGGGSSGGGSGSNSPGSRGGRRW